ncbi:DJ-1/PfpI family protein [Devosia sp.]|uniref:DJ-1/PfpI family protein n=1 Tax=Devosia sp. TaxID=1871048 RepID=UPI001B274E01|nr:DJ-1/PfpI family protein [Devosia sp.]MBO9588532.1 DJ-1/PfpI family protein [Devosia sp.]
MKRFLAVAVAAVVSVGLLGFGIWIAMLPPTTVLTPQIPPAAEAKAAREALAPKRSGRPVIAVIGLNDATETTDYLMPTGILRRADIADVMMLATAQGPVQLYPALNVEPDATISEFDAAHPDGADYVVVPAMSRDDDPAVLAWLQQQSAKGAIVIGICAGAKVVGAAGLLDGKRATTHWFYLRDLLRRSPTIDYVADRRMVIDGNIATTTGITASMPMMLTLIEAIAGREKAQGVAAELGVEHWDARHASGAFTLTRPFVTTIMANTLAFWNREEFEMALEEGMDEASLALVADAWSRTYRSKVVSFAQAPVIVSANGIRILPDRNSQEGSTESMVSNFSDQKPAAALDQGLQAINERYGLGTADVVAMQLEYPTSNTAR